MHEAIHMRKNSDEICFFSRDAPPSAIAPIHCGRVRTPGGKLTIQYLKKLPSTPKCGDTGQPLFGVAVARPKELMGMSRRKKTVSRCYGGVLSGIAVRNR